MSLILEQAIAAASELIVPYKEKQSSVNFDVECREITRLIADCEQRLVALYPALDFVWAKKIPYVASVPLVYWYFHNGWCVSDNYSHLNLKISKQPNHYVLGITDTLSKTTRGFVWFDIGRQERSRNVTEESKGWFFKKTASVNEKYLSEVCLFKVRVAYELKQGPAFDTTWDAGEYSVPELAEVMTNSLYLSPNNVRKSQAKFLLELFEKLPACLAQEVRAVLK